MDRCFQSSYERHFGLLAMIDREETLTLNGQYSCDDSSVKMALEFLSYPHPHECVTLMCVCDTHTLYITYEMMTGCIESASLLLF